MSKGIDLMETELSDIEGLSIEDRILRLEMCLQASMEQDTKLIELVTSTIDRLNELNESFVNYAKSQDELNESFVNYVKNKKDSGSWLRF